MTNEKQDRTLEIFFRGLRGEDLSVAKLAEEYGISAKSVSRSIGDLKTFLAEHRDLVGNAELQYSFQNKCYRLHLEEFLSSKELFAIVEVLIGARALSRIELLTVVDKLKQFTSSQDRKQLQELIRKEMYHYPEVMHDCESVVDTLWQLVCCIRDKREISIDYYRMDRTPVTHRLRPASILFTDFYFYLIAFQTEGETDKPLYFRVDRIRHITEHRQKITASGAPDFDEGLLRRRSLFMWPGKLRTIRFAFCGPSIQAVLDKLPTAKIIERSTGGRFLVEAEVYGDGIKMWLLSQGAWVRVIAPDDFVEEMRLEIAKMAERYDES